MATAEMATPKPRSLVEIGFDDNMPFTEPYRGSHLVYKHSEVTVQQLVRMRRTDGQARALYRLITLPIRAALQTATFVPAQVEEGGEAEAEFIE
jgi:predicted RNA binding protein YcfA (HicA-like mRNA interferase family)